MKVAIVGKYPPMASEILERELVKYENVNVEIVDTMEKYEKLTDADCIILRIFKVRKEDIDRNKNLKFVQKWGTGFDSIDIDYAREKGIDVSNVPGANAGIVSEIAILLMLAVYRKLLAHDENIRKGIWTKGEFIEESFSLNNKTLGLLGAGNIGRRVARKAQAFGARVQYYDIYRLSTDMEEEFDLEFKSFDEIIKTSDIISLHLPLNDSTRNIIGKEEIYKMKENAVIINTARGGLVDEEALVEALNNNVILGAGLDCFDKEPIDKDNNILKARNTVLTPHIGGTSMDLLDTMVPEILENVVRFINHEDLKYIVNEKRS